MLTRSKPSHKYHILQRWLDDYNKRPDYDKYFHGFSEVHENIYISSRDIIRSDDLEELGIKSILTLGLENKLSERLTQNVDNHLCIDIEDVWDEGPMLEILPDTHKFINEALQHGPVLVHCTAGISRSSTVVIYYLMTQGMPLDYAIQQVKERRNCIAPNLYFLKALCLIEEELNFNRYNGYQ